MFDLNSHDICKEICDTCLNTKPCPRCHKRIYRSANSTVNGLNICIQCEHEENFHFALPRDEDIGALIYCCECEKKKPQEEFNKNHAYSAFAQICKECDCCDQEQDEQIKRDENMSTYCIRCEINDHTSCMMETPKGPICRVCQIKQGDDMGFACACGEWEPDMLKHMIVKGCITRCPKCDKSICRTDSPKYLVDHPAHYQGNGLEAIDVIEAFDLSFCLGNAVKYILRAGKKDSVIQELEKAIWYLKREIENNKKDK